MRYRVTAEHTQGKSVDHPCTKGVYSDPADKLDLEVEAADESAAIAAGVKWLEERCAEMAECDCRRKLAPGGNAWWNSVAVHAEKAST